MFAKFGPGGNSAAFSKKYKSTADAPLYLKEMGLSAYEYECGQGVKISQASAEIIGKNAKENGISLSLHSPYFISFITAVQGVAYAGSTSSPKRALITVLFPPHTLFHIPFQRK
mgnify:CR=1 FL=1